MRQFVYQEDEKGCGLACLRMALIEATGEKNYKYLRLEEHPPYTLKQLQEAAAKEGVELTFYKAENKEEFVKLDQFPVLLLLKENDSEHLVYATQARKEKIQIYDPALGPYWASRAELMEKWGLVYGEVEVTSKEKCNWRPPKLCSFSDLFFPSLFSLLSSLSLFAAFFFMKDEGNYIVSILLLALYGILEILSRQFLGKAMKRFDEKWLRKIVASKEETHERYLRFYSIKRHIFPSFFRVVVSLIAAILVTALFGLNNAFFFLSVAGLLLYLLVSELTIWRGINRRKKKLECDEKNLFQGVSDEVDAAQLIQNLNQESYQIGSFLSYERIVYVAFLLGLALLPLAMAETVTLNYYLLHFAALFSIGEALKNVFGYFSETPSREADLLYFYEYFMKEEN